MALKYLTKVKSRAALIKADPMGAIVAQVQDVLEQHQHSKTIQASFEAGEVGTIKVYFPYPVVIQKVRYYVNKALAATDAGTVDVKDSGGTTIVAQTSIPLSTVFGTEPTAIVPTGANAAVAKGGFVQIITAKTTAGGRCLVSLEYTLGL